MVPEKRERLDQLLVDRALVATRSKARALIMAGDVLVNDAPIDKAGTLVGVDANIRIRGVHSQYVSRGGDKIAPVLDEFGFDLTGAVALDVGASTGGFTDCMLQRGALLVYAVDVGWNQLDHKLRTDPRVVVMEKMHAKDLVSEFFSKKPRFATIDVSFISLRVVLPFVVSVLESPASLVCLVKPQFELGREYVGKGGVVREREDQLKAVELVTAFGVEMGLRLLGSSASPLPGAKKGNQEYFVCFVKDR